MGLSMPIKLIAIPNPAISVTPSSPTYIVSIMFSRLRQLAAIATGTAKRTSPIPSSIISRPKYERTAVCWSPGVIEPYLDAWLAPLVRETGTHSCVLLSFESIPAQFFALVVLHYSCVYTRGSSLQQQQASFRQLTLSVGTEQRLEGNTSLQPVFHFSIFRINFLAHESFLFIRSAGRSRGGLLQQSCAVVMVLRMAGLLSVEEGAGLQMKPWLVQCSVGCR